MPILLVGRKTLRWSTSSVTRLRLEDQLCAALCPVTGCFGVAQGVSLVVKEAAAEAIADPLKSEWRKIAAERDVFL